MGPGRKRDPYELLGIQRDADADAIEAAYQSLANYWDPEFNVHPQARSRWKAVRGAYRTLGDPARRARHDRRALSSRPAAMLPGRWPVLAVAALVVAFAVIMPFGLHADRLLQAQPRSADTVHEPAVPDLGTKAAPLQPPPAAPPASPQLAAPDPRSITLGLGDLAPGYQVVRAGPATFAQGDPNRSSWDAVFQRGSPTSPDFTISESLAIVYTSSAEAQAAVAELATADGAQGAHPLVGTPAGQDGQVWVQSVPDRLGYELARVRIRVGNVIAEVRVLGATSASVQEVLQLAAAQQRHLSRPAA